MNRIIVIGFTLFALFFGAGNLIFPLKLGFESGTAFNMAILGFLITGVGLPLVGLIASSFSNGGIPRELEIKVHQTFSVIFMIFIYLTIGPLFAIPRTASTSYEIGIAPFVGSSQLNLAIFSIAYFGVALYLSLNTSKMIDIIGKVLTPCLLIAIALLCIRSFMILDEPVTEVLIGRDGTNPTIVGFLDGYLTMDAIASLAFGIIALSAVKAAGFSQGKGLLKNCTLAALVAGASLGLTYYALGWLGNHFPIDSASFEELNKNGTHLGAYLLVESAHKAYGITAQALVAIIVLLACLTTAIGLIVAASGYFHGKFPIMSHRNYAIIFTLISAVISIQGLQEVISLSVPVLRILYPVCMIVISLTLVDKVITLPNLCYQLAIAVTLIVSLMSQFMPSELLTDNLYLYEQSLGWLIPGVLAGILGFALGKIFKTSTIAVYTPDTKI